MRTDIIIDRRFVRCPNASTLAYGKYRAQVGDWVTWRYPEADGTIYTGRMIGRIAYDPTPATAEYRNTRGWIVCLTLGMEMTTVFERWVDPQWVTQVHANTPDIARFLAWFAGALPDVDYLRRLCEYGAGKANQCPDQPDWDCAQGIRRFEEYYTRVQKAQGK